MSHSGRDDSQGDGAVRDAEGDAPRPGERGREELVSVHPKASPVEGSDSLVRDTPRAVTAAAAPLTASFGLATDEQLNAFRELRTRLMLMAAGEGRQHFTTIVVPVIGDAGGSFVARNLAASFTLQDHPALLIECNFRRA